jgi:hypothetical protein
MPYSSSCSLCEALHFCQCRLVPNHHRFLK